MGFNFVGCFCPTSEKFGSRFEPSLADDLQLQFYLLQKSVFVA